MEQLVDKELFTRDIERALTSQDRCDEIPRGNANNRGRLKSLTKSIARALYDVLETERRPLMQVIGSLRHEAKCLRQEAVNLHRELNKARQKAEALRKDGEPLRAEKEDIGAESEALRADLVAIVTWLDTDKGAQAAKVAIKRARKLAAA
jgi:uncharacterized coiled-coil DUF342 family protein